ncbi:MAG: hypothetical protein V3V67_04575 [Myxococcota bacterium]
MYFKGYNSFSTEPGARDELHCRVCGTACEVTRNAYGPTCFAAAIGGMAKLHDDFRCPHSDAEWHDQALNLVMESDGTASKRLSDQIRLDLQELLAENGIEVD